MKMFRNLESAFSYSGSGVYAIMNIKTLGVYIGESIDIAHRNQTHLNFLRKNKHENYKLQLSWNKYGEENFVFIILQKCEWDELCYLEKLYIDKFPPERVYNISTRGCSVKGSTLNEETKQKISQSLKGRRPPKESLINLNLGPVTRQRKIKMFSLDGVELMEFESIVHAQTYLNKKSDVCIRDALKGRANHAYGFQWRYA